MDLTRESVVVARSGMPSASVSGETVLLSLENDEYYGMGLVGSRIWERIAVPIRVGDLCGLLAEVYDATPATIEADVLVFLKSLAAKGLLEIRSSK
ncbi:MAG: PqqD family protein [Alphaproteobacteria bacterium]